MTHKYSKIMVFGTGAKNEAGELYLSKIGEARCCRAVEAWYSEEFDRNKGQILVTGKCGHSVFESPPKECESLLMISWIKEHYKAIPDEVFLPETESTKTEENYILSEQLYPEFFEGARSGEERIGLVTSRQHMVWAVEAGRRVLSCYAGQFIELEAWKPTTYKR